MTEDCVPVLIITAIFVIVALCNIRACKFEISRWKIIREAFNEIRDGSPLRSPLLKLMFSAIASSAVKTLSFVATLVFLKIASEACGVDPIGDFILIIEALDRIFTPTSS